MSCRACSCSLNGAEHSQVGTGKNNSLIKRLGEELDRLGVPVRDRVICLIWDEVNLLGQVCDRRETGDGLKPVAG